jgi:hypothetical protein
LNALHVVGAATGFALRRIRERPLSVATLFVAAAGAAALIGWSSVAAALAQERNARAHLRDTPAADRSLRVTYFTQPLEPDADAATVAATIRSFRDVTTGDRLVRIWHPVAPADETGTRVVVAREPALDVDVTAGRLPASGCADGACPALALAGQYRLGERVKIGPTRVRIVGLGSLRPQALADRSQLGRRALLVRSLDRSLRRTVRGVGSNVVVTAPLDPEAVAGFDLGPLRERLREAVVRLQRSDPNGLLQATAPLGLLDGLAARGRTARERLLLVAGEGAALVVAFAAFATAIRRREALVLADQLATFGASRTQLLLVRATESLLPSLLGAALAVAGLFVAAWAIGRQRGSPGGFVAAALPADTILAIAAVTLLAAALLVVSVTPRRRARFGVGALELAAGAALGITVWQASTTGGLDPQRVATEGVDPVLVLLPALAFFVTGVVFLRLLPLGLRLLEHLARRAPFGVRLAFLDAARHPAQAAAATTFLAVAIGGALFSLDYRATLDHHARDQATFDAGAEWRVAERSPGHSFGPTDVTPTTRFALVSSERPALALRLDADVRPALASSEPLGVTLLGVPAGRLHDVRGWREGFSSLSRAEIAARLRPAPIRYRGPALANGATRLRFWARTDTRRPRIVVVHLLTRGGSFAHLRAGVVWRSWQRVSLPLPRRLRGSQLVALEFLPSFVALSEELDPSGDVQLAPVKELRGGRWRTLTSLAGWQAAAGAPGGYLVDGARFAPGSPVPQGAELDLNGTYVPLIHPGIAVPKALPALVGGPVAAQSVDRQITLDIGGRELPVRVAGTAQLFPTVVDSPDDFVVVDYDMLYAALNLDRPGSTVASEAWFFRPQAAGFRDRLSRPPFRLESAVGARETEAKLLDDPLAGGTREVLGIATLVAALLGVLGLVLGARSTLASERGLLAEYEALGVPPRTLARSTQIRLLVLSLAGLAAGLLGALVTVRMTSSFVAVTGAAGTPLPPIASRVAWGTGALLLAAVALVGGGAVALIAGRALRETAARRLRA